MESLGRIGSSHRPAESVHGAVVTGVGAVAPIGCGVDAYWKGLVHGASRFSDYRGGADKRYAAGLVDLDECEELKPPSRSWSSMDKLSKLMCAAVSSGLQNAGLDAENLASERTGVVVGTGFSTIDTNALFIRTALEDHPRFVSPVDFANATPNTPAAQVAIHFGFTGPNTTLSTGESSGLRAVSYALDLLARGHADVLVVGACETVSRFTLERFELADKMSSGCVAPFDRNRSGTVVSEGAACIVLEREECARRRRARTLARFLGDAHAHVPGGARPTERSAGVDVLTSTMSRALDRAEVPLTGIDFVSGGSNGSTHVDATELGALGCLCEQRDASLRVVSIKSVLGETYGASAMFQLVAACLSMEHGELPPNRNLHDPDTSSQQLRFRHEGAVTLRTSLINAFDVSGSCASIVVSKGE